MNSRLLLEKNLQTSEETGSDLCVRLLIRGALVLWTLATQTLMPLSSAVKAFEITATQIYSRKRLKTFYSRSVYQRALGNKLKTKTKKTPKGLRWRKSGRKKEKPAMETQTRPKPPCSKNLLMWSTMSSRPASHLASSASNFSRLPPCESWL